MFCTNLHRFRTLTPPRKLSWFPSAWEFEFFWTCNCLGPNPTGRGPPVELRMLHWLQSLSSSNMPNLLVQTRPDVAPRCGLDSSL